MKLSSWIWNSFTVSKSSENRSWVPYCRRVKTSLMCSGNSRGRLRFLLWYEWLHGRDASTHHLQKLLVGKVGFEPWQKGTWDTKAPDPVQDSRVRDALKYFGHIEINSKKWSGIGCYSNTSEKSQWQVKGERNFRKPYWSVSLWLCDKKIEHTLLH